MSAPTKAHDVRQVAVSPYVRVLVHNGPNIVSTVALLDPGCETSLISQELASVLNLTGSRARRKLGTFHGRDPNLTITQSSCQISSTTGVQTMLAVNPLLIVPELKVNKRFINWLQHQYRWPHLKGIELPTFDWREVGIFIGANVPEALRQLDLRESSDGGLDGVKTPFVWTVQGNIPLEVCLSTTVSCKNIFNLEDDDFLKQFWLQELCGSVEDRKRTLTTQDEIELATLANTIRKVGTATKPHYEIGLPFKTPVIQLPNNRSDALKLLYARESRFRTDPAYAEKYTKAIEMYMEKGFARRLAMSELKGPVGKTWYVPHALVENPNKPDKPRLIFDARRKFNNRCLNDAFHNGPLLMTDMMDVIFFFRQKPHAVSMDITKMFLQVRIKSEDQTVFRFFWRRPGDPGPPIAYQMMVLIFGASLSPTCVAYVLRHIVKDHPEYADVAELVVKKFYVDNYLDSFETVEEGIETCRRLRELLFLGGFVLGQLATSTREILQSVPASDRANPDLNVDLDDLPIHRTLGLEWSGEDDSFFFTYCAPKATTKRQLLSAVSAIYDPLLCDSDNVLYWLRSQATLYAPFISGRKEQILAVCPATRWRHVPSELNPADDLSRGIDANELTADHESLMGPSFLVKREDEWPQRLGGGGVQNDSLEIIRPVAVCEEVGLNAVVAIDTEASLRSQPTADDLIEAATSLPTLKRSVAELTAAPDELLTPAALREGFECCVKVAQRSANSLRSWTRMVYCEWEDA